MSEYPSNLEQEFRRIRMGLHACENICNYVQKLWDQGIAGKQRMQCQDARRDLVRGKNRSPPCFSVGSISRACTCIGLRARMAIR